MSGITGADYIILTCYAIWPPLAGTIFALCKLSFRFILQTAFTNH